MLGSLLSSPLGFLIAGFSLIFSLTVHEFCHALVADKLGDPTPRLQGRVTLNPLAHLDPLGTIALLLVGFGWGKPVQFDPYNLKNPVRDASLIALVGPLSNFALAIICSIALKLGANHLAIPAYFLVQMVMTNLILGIFNFVPVAPLDGSKIVLALLPRRLAYDYEAFMNQFGFMILLVLIFPWYQGISPISFVINPIINFVGQILL